MKKIIIITLLLCFNIQALATTKQSNKAVKFVTSSIRDELFFIHPKPCKFIEGISKEWQNSVFYCLKHAEIQILSSQIANEVSIEYYAKLVKKGYDEKSFGVTGEIKKISAQIQNKEVIGRAFLSGINGEPEDIWKTVVYKVTGKKYIFYIMATGPEKNWAVWQNLEAFLSFVTIK